MAAEPEPEAEPPKTVLFAADLTFARRSQKDFSEFSSELCQILKDKYDKLEPTVFFDRFGDLNINNLGELCDNLDGLYLNVAFEHIRTFSPMIAKLDEVIKNKHMESFEFVFISDGHFKDTYEELLHAFKTSEFLSRVTKIHFFMFGNGMPGVRNIERMLSIFQGIPAEVVINNVLYVKKQDPIWKEGDDVMSTLELLEKRLAKLDVSSETKVPVRENLDLIEKYYSWNMVKKVCLEQGVTVTGDSPTDVIRKLLRPKDTQKLKQLASTLKRTQTSDKVYAKIQKLYRKLSKGMGESFHPMHSRACKMSLRCLSDYVKFVPPETPAPDLYYAEGEEFPFGNDEDVAGEGGEDLGAAENPDEAIVDEDANVSLKVGETQAAGNEENAQNEPAITEQNCPGTDSQAVDNIAGASLVEAGKDTPKICDEKCADELDFSSTEKNTTQVIQENDVPQKAKREGSHAKYGKDMTSQEHDSAVRETSDSSPKLGLKKQDLDPKLIPGSSEDDAMTEVISDEERQYRRSDTVEADKANQPGTSADADNKTNEEDPKNEESNEENRENNENEEEDEERKEPSEMFEKAKYWNSEEDQHLLHIPDDPQRLCAVFQIESKIHVIQMQTAPISQIITNDYRNPWLHRYRLEECPFRIFELIDTKPIENLILSDHVSIESYIYTVTSADRSEDEAGLSFRSTCTLNVYPIFVYNFTNPNKIDLYEDETSELYAEKTEFDEYLVEHLCGIFLQQFLSSKTIRGSKPLWAISLLYMIYNTKRIQKHQFLKECLRNTILRISIVFECDLSLFPDLYPKLKVSIKDALTYIAETSEVYCTSRKGCVFCRLGEGSARLIDMLRNIFNLQPPPVMCWALRISSDYLHNVYNNPESKRFLETIVKTKVQDWIDTENGPLLLAGKTNEDVYNDCLKLTNASVLYQMAKCLESQKVLTHLKASVDQLLCTNITLHSVDLFYDTCLLEHVKLCRSTCRPISICPATKMPWQRCLTPDCEKSELSFFNIYGKFCRKFKFFPYIDDMLSFLVKQYPNKMFYNNTEEILTKIIQKFKDLNISVGEFNEHFKNSYLPAKRLEIERTCPCPAHASV